MYSKEPGSLWVVETYLDILSRPTQDPQTFQGSKPSKQVQINILNQHTSDVLRTSLGNFISTVYSSGTDSPTYPGYGQANCIQKIKSNN